RSKSRSSMPVACFENTLKLVPSVVTVEPRGAADPAERSSMAGGPVALERLNATVFFTSTLDGIGALRSVPGYSRHGSSSRAVDRPFRHEARFGPGWLRNTGGPSPDRADS